MSKVPCALPDLTGFGKSSIMYLKTTVDEIQGKLQGVHYIRLASMDAACMVKICDDLRGSDFEKYERAWMGQIERRGGKDFLQIDKGSGFSLELPILKWTKLWTGTEKAMVEPMPEIKPYRTPEPVPVPETEFIKDPAKLPARDAFTMAAQDVMLGILSADPDLLNRKELPIEQRIKMLVRSLRRQLQDAREKLETHRCLLTIKDEHIRKLEKQLAQAHREARHSGWIGKNERRQVLAILQSVVDRAGVVQSGLVSESFNGAISEAQSLLKRLK